MVSNPLESAACDLAVTHDTNKKDAVNHFIFLGHMISAIAESPLMIIDGTLARAYAAGTDFLTYLGDFSLGLSGSFTAKPPVIPST